MPSRCAQRGARRAPWRAEWNDAENRGTDGKARASASHGLALPSHELAQLALAEDLARRDGAAEAELDRAADALFARLVETYARAPLTWARFLAFRSRADRASALR